MNRKLRIAVWYNLPSGGAKRALYYHVRGLAQRGHHLEVWSPPVSERDYLPLSDWATEHLVDGPSLYTPEHPGPAAKSYIGRVKQFARLWDDWFKELDDHAKAAGQEINAGGFDVLFANNCWMFHAPFIGRHVKGPKLLYLQEPNRRLYEAWPHLVWRSIPPFPRGTPFTVRLRHLMRDYYANRGRRRQVDHEHFNAAAFDRILVNSYYSRESVLRAYGLDSVVCYLGIDTELFQSSGQPKESFVVGTGKFAEPKNPMFVVKALGSLQKPPKLVWVANGGDEDYTGLCRRRARELGVDLEIRLNVSDEALVDLLGRAAVMACPQRLEPFGFAPLEANACGTPVVAIAEAGLRETVVNGLNGIVVPMQREQMGRALQGYTSDLSLARQEGCRAAAHVREHWTLERSIDRLESNLLDIAS